MDASSVPVPSSLPADVALPERLGYRVKRVLLGPPLTSAQLQHEKLSKKAALGVLSSDCISSAAYGTEEMLIVLLVVFGLSGFSILLPMTAVVLGVLLLMTLSYREVVMVYTQAGGSYVVARENFGPRTAQIASVALLIDYVVTVAVQAAAAVAALTSLAPALERWTLELTVAAIVLLAYGNLRGVREAGRVFAFPTYCFVGAVGLVVVVGVARELFGDLPRFALDRAGQIPVHDGGHAVLSAFAIFYLLQAFANGGSSLTGLEAISNGVSAFEKPRGVNARRTLSTMSLLLGFLVGGISWLAYQTHAAPYADGAPTVVSQVARAAFGDSPVGHVGFVIVQLATALILFTGANTPFTGFPFLASFIAEDSFLPRQLTRRGDRLVFSNGILVLTALALALVLVVGANVNALVPFYAIGVFTGFTMAGLGMARYHRRVRESGWRHKQVVNAAGGVVSAVVVLIFAVVKFTEGAWLVVILFPLGWFALTRLNRQYRREQRSLEVVAAAGGRVANYPRHTILVMVDRLDLAVIRALRYAGSLHPSELRAVHLMIDSEVAQNLELAWIAFGLGDRVPLEIVDCPDRRLIATAAAHAMRTVVTDETEVTVLLPRRTFLRLTQRLLHDRTADRIAAAVSRIPHVSATIVPFDTTIDADTERRIGTRARNNGPSVPAPDGAATPVSTPPVVVPPHDAAPAPAPPAGRSPAGGDGRRPAVPTRIVDAARSARVVVEGRVQSVQVGTAAGRNLEVQVFDGTGGIRLLFMGRTTIAGLEPGVLLRATGTVGEYKGYLAVANPTYEILASV